MDLALLALAAFLLALCGLLEAYGLARKHAPSRRWALRFGLAG